MMIDVYCDGSISNAVLLNPLQSQLSETYVARLVVLIPTCDLGLIEIVGLLKNSQSVKQ